MNFLEYETKQRDLLNKAFNYLNELTNLAQQFSEEQAQAPRNNTTASLEEVKTLIKAYNLFSVYEKENTSAIYREIAKNKLTPVEVEEVFIKVYEQKRQGKIKKIIAYLITSIQEKRKAIDKENNLKANN